MTERQKAFIDLMYFLTDAGRYVSYIFHHMIQIWSLLVKQWLKSKRWQTIHPPFSIIHLIPCLNHLINLKGKPCNHEKALSNLINTAVSRHVSAYLAFVIA